MLEDVEEGVYEVDFNLGFVVFVKWLLIFYIGKFFFVVVFYVVLIFVSVLGFLYLVMFVVICNMFKIFFLLGRIYVFYIFFIIIVEYLY